MWQETSPTSYTLVPVLSAFHFKIYKIWSGSDWFANLKLVSSVKIGSTIGSPKLKQIISFINLNFTFKSTKWLTKCYTNLLCNFKFGQQLFENNLKYFSAAWVLASMVQNKSLPGNMIFIGRVVKEETK